MNEQKTANSPPLERALGALGGLLIVALLAFLVYEAAVSPNQGPELNASVSKIERTGDQFVVQIGVENTGGDTAEAVNVEGALRAGDKLLERASTTISYVPVDSVRHGALVFSSDPSEHQLSVTAAGYVLP